MSDGSLHPKICSAFVAVNTIVRLFFPSQYIPRRMEPGYEILSSPFLARILATVAEPCFLEVLARCVNLGFWGCFIGNMTILGELVCWFALFTQSQILSELEDMIWMTIHIYIGFYGSGNLPPLSLLFVTSILFFHSTALLRYL
jgi:hypothetical protein